MNDYASTVCINQLTDAHISQKLRVAGQLRLYDPETSVICLSDDDVILLVDISMCIAGLHSCRWLHEENTIVMVVGYLEKLELPEDSDIPPMVLRALFVRERRDLDLDVWNKAIEVHQQRRSNEIKAEKSVKHDK